jgi:hypothetical protein
MRIPLTNSNPRQPSLASIEEESTSLLRQFGAMFSTAKQREHREHRERA